MLIAMVPIIYLMLKKRDFCLYIVAPFASIILYGYTISTNGSYLGHGTGVMIMGGITRAICGLLFGIDAWLISKKLTEKTVLKSQRILLTVVEVVMCLLIFYILFTTNDAHARNSVMLLFPILIAIMNSKKSYVSRLFKMKWLRMCGSLSLYIFLTHGIARITVNKYFRDERYLYCVLAMAALTVMYCILNYIIVKTARFIWTKKLRSIFIANK